MKIFLSFLSCLLFVAGAGAQTKKPPVLQAKKTNPAQVKKPADEQRKKARVFYNAGIEQKKSNNFNEALNSFAKATMTDARYDSAFVEMAGIFAGGGNTDMAMYNFKNALNINPKYTDALTGMAKVYRDAKKNLDSAIYYFTAAEAVDKNNKEIYYGLAWIYNAKKDFDKAILYGIKSLEADNTYKPAYGELGFAYRSSNRMQDCVDQFKKNLAVSVVDVAYLYSGYAYIELKNKEGAMQQYDGLMKVNEKMAGALKKKIDAAFP